MTLVVLEIPRRYAPRNDIRFIVSTFDLKCGILSAYFIDVGRMTEMLVAQDSKTIDLPLTREDILRDYQIAYQSRQASVIGRREVMSGKGKFGIFGDGKELPQIAMARAFRHGDFRSGYYRDQTFMLAIN